jgi:hypothetical protein
MQTEQTAMGIKGKTYLMLILAAAVGAVGGAVSADFIVSGRLYGLFRAEFPLVLFVIGVPIWFVALLTLDIAIGDLTFPIPGATHPMRGPQSQVMWFVVLMLAWAISIRLLAGAGTFQIK